MGNQWKEEQNHVDFVLSEIDKKKDRLEENTGVIREDILGIRENFWDDVTVNLDEAHEIGETFTSIKQQKEMLAERERSHIQFNDQLKKLYKLKNSPYFGRVDFLEGGETDVDRIYLGITSLMDENEEEFLIYDWRAPISSLYYDYSPGIAQYVTPQGIIEGEMKLKRQFIIRNGKIKGMFDTGVTIGDELLQEVLGNNANTQMKSIVATIQKEQNEIIRNERSKYLIVQGVAGSGKTSAALQRVAYLLYRNRDQFNSENMMLFSPNPLFNSYVATVLPELGEENIQQTTFQQYIGKRIGKDFALEDSFSQMEYILSSVVDDDYETRVESIHFKASLDFRDYIDDYVRYLSEEGLIFKNISLQGQMLISSQVIKEYFYSLDSSLPLPNRMELVSKWLLKELMIIERRERKKEWVIEEAELLDKEDYLKIYKEIEKRQKFEEDSFDDHILEEKLLADWVVKKYFRPIRRAVKQLKFVHVKALYKQLFTTKKIANFDSSVLPSNWEAICSQTLQMLGNKELAYEDATPYLYLIDQVKGLKTNREIKHLFIDEAQDYSPFQFAFLKQLFPSCKMTVLGDLNQAIYAHTIKAPTILSDDHYNTQEYEKIELTRSYRSTKQIVEFTKNLIYGGEVIEAFNRNGQKPSLIQMDDMDQLHKNIGKIIGELEAKNHETIAIICKTAEESRKVFNTFKERKNVRLMEKNTSTFEKGVLILPTYLAKGIEFDAVLIYNASNEEYGKEQERKLFYTACTRAMHELYIFSLGERSRFISEVPDQKYDVQYA